MLKLDLHRAGAIAVALFPPHDSRDVAHFPTYDGRADTGAIVSSHSFVRTDAAS